MKMVELPPKRASLSLRKCLVLLIAIGLFSTAFFLVFEFGRSWYQREQVETLGARLLYMPTRPIGSAQQYGVELEGPHINDAVITALVPLLESGTIHHQTLIFKETSVTAQGLRYLADLHTLESLVIAGSDIGDAGITNVSRIRSLKSLTLDGTNVTIRHFQSLQDLPDLESLALTITDAAPLPPTKDFNGRRPSRVYLTVTDSALAIVARLPNISEIYITGHHVTDKGMSELDGVSNIVAFIAENCSISDSGLDYLSRSRRLQYLDLSGTSITDVATSRFGDFPRLRHLNLSDTAVTDTGVQSLAALTSLRKLWLNATNVSPQAMTTLKQELPATSIFR